MNGSLTHLKRELAFHRNHQLRMGALVAGAGALLLVFLSLRLPNGIPVAVQVIVTLIIIIGVYLMVRAIRQWNSDKHPIIIKMDREPKELVWVYPYLVLNMPFGIHVMQMATIYFYDIHGDHTTIRVREKELDTTMKHLNRLLPHATFGHSVEKEQLYRADPALMLRKEN